MSLFPKPAPKRALGVQRQEEQLAFVWLNENQQPETVSLAICDDLISKLNQQLPQALRYWQVVAAAPHQYTWSKILILPQTLNEAESMQQSRFVLQKSLPIALDELWFDYQTEKLPQGFRLDVTAIQAAFAETFVASFAPLKLQVLDTESNSLIRAFTYLLKKDLANCLLLYANEKGAFALCETAQQRQILQGSCLQDVFLAFQEQFKTDFAAIYVYSETMESIAANWQALSCEVPLMALGNALWSREVELR